VYVIIGAVTLGVAALIVYTLASRKAEEAGEALAPEVPEEPAPAEEEKTEEPPSE
jgi:hypothetical protein